MGRQAKGLAVLVGGCVLLALAACGGPDSSSVKSSPQCDAVGADDGPGAGSAASHGQPRRSDGEVVVSQQNGQFRATRLVSIANDFGGAAQAQVDLSSMNGNVSACVRQGGGYRINVTLEARAPTEQAARDALDTMVVNHGDALAAGALALNTRVDFATGGAGSGITIAGIDLGGASGDVQRGAHIAAGLPAGASYRFNHMTSNGDVEDSGFSGAAAKLSSSNGSVALDGRWDTASLDTSNGVVAVSGDYAALDASTTNGVIGAALATQRSLSATLSSSNGLVDVMLQPSGAGFDLQAGTTNGQASIDVPGTDPVGPQTGTSAHRRTPDYSSRSVQVQVNASSSNGNASIHQ